MRQGVVNRNGPTELKINAKGCDHLLILVENQGRINGGSKMTDPKGIITNVTLNKEILTNWEAAPFSSLDYVGRNQIEMFDDNDTAGVYVGQIPMPVHPPEDSYLLLKGWNKVYINLDRYLWSIFLL